MSLVGAKHGEKERAFRGGPGTSMNESRILWNRSPASVKQDEGRESVPDAQLVRRFQETADPDAFAEIFRRYRRQIYAACRAFLGESGAAEDATQETFVRAYRNIAQFREGNLPGWLTRIARNVCIDEWRKQRPETGIEDADAAVAAPSRSGQPGVDSMADLRFAAQKVREEMAGLPEEQRRCLEMKIEGYSYEETAARTGLPVAAVKSHLQNGRRMLWLRTQSFLDHLK
jgi:RNA polymerase sigma-70 factor, ECF subfamily